MDITQSLLQLQSAAYLRLVLETERWLAVTDEIRRGRCNVQRLFLTILEATKSKAIEAVKAVASAIQIDENLEYLSLQLEDVISDEAGVALAEALTVNKTLRKMRSVVNAAFTVNPPFSNTDALGAPPIRHSGIWCNAAWQYLPQSGVSSVPLSRW